MDTYTAIIVEDDDVFATLLTHYLTEFPGLKVIDHFSDTTKAALMIERHKPDIVFLDVMISGLNGPEFMELVEHNPKVVIISGHNEDIMNDYPLEYVAFIEKPVTKEIVHRAVQQCVDQLS